MIVSPGARRDRLVDIQLAGDFRHPIGVHAADIGAGGGGKLMTIAMYGGREGPVAPATADPEKHGPEQTQVTARVARRPDGRLPCSGRGLRAARHWICISVMSSHYALRPATGPTCGPAALRSSPATACSDRSQASSRSVHCRVHTGVPRDVPPADERHCATVVCRHVEDPPPGDGAAALRHRGGAHRTEVRRGDIERRDQRVGSRGDVADAARRSSPSCCVAAG